MNNSQNGMNGFTILELLIVIAIISAIIIMGFSNYSGAQKKARDTRRKSDLKQIQKALELYRGDQTVPSFPLTDVFLNPPGNCWSSGGAAAICPNANIYMNKVPGDPNRTTSAGAYYYVPIGSLQYRLCACLENTSDLDGSSGSCDNVNYICSSGKKYELTQP